MARFRGTVQGSRGEASRLGSASSGLRGSINGWDLGLDVAAYAALDGAGDVVQALVTGGSNGSAAPRVGISARQKEKGVSVSIMLEGAVIQEMEFDERGYRIE